MTKILLRGGAVTYVSPETVEIDLTGGIEATVHLSAADLVVLTPGLQFQAVAAPGAGKVLLPNGPATVQFKPGLGWYASNSLILRVWYGNDSSLTAINNLGDFPPSSTVAFSPAGSLGLIWATNEAHGVDEISNQGLNVGVENGSLTFTGPILASVKNAGGSGYAPGDTGTVDGDPFGSNPAQYTVNTVGVGGAVLTYHITSGHDPAYVVATGVTTTSVTGGGSGFTINVTSIPSPDGEAWVTFAYSILTLH